jgi:ABC-2 type transport system ATP-binding protein
MADTSAPAIEIHGVRKSFDRTVAVDGLDLTVPRGATYGLLGPNGSGKTTTVRLILGILEPDGGEIRVLGDQRSPAILDRVGYLPEERGLYRRMRVRPLLLFLAEIKGVPASRAGPRIDAWLERVELAERAESRVQELSKGMQQKLQFLAAVVHDPELVILDEPFGGLDPINQEVLRSIVGELQRMGRTILLSTHMIEHAEWLCDHVCILARGRAAVDGPIERIKQEHSGATLREIFLDRAGGRVGPAEERLA